MKVGSTGKEDFFTKFKIRGLKLKNSPEDFEVRGGTAMITFLTLSSIILSNP
jgi:hypothetical protein